MVSTTQCFLKATVFKTVPNVGMVGRAQVEGQGRGTVPGITWVQLAGQRAGMSSR